MTQTELENVLQDYCNEHLLESITYIIEYECGTFEKKILPKNNEEAKE